MYNNRYKAKIPVATNRTEPQYRDQGIIKFLSRDITLQQVVDMVESEFIATRESIAIRWWLADHVIHLITDERPSQSTKWWLREVGDYIDGAISLQQVTDNLEIYARSLSPAEKNSYVFYWVSDHERLQSLAINYCLTIVDRDFYYSINQLLDVLREYWEVKGAAKSWKDASINLANTVRHKLLDFYSSYVNRDFFSWRQY